MTTPSSIQGNTVRNVTWLTTFDRSALPGIWSGILLTGGSANVGTVAGNTIGSGVGTGSISVTTSGQGGATFGIASSSSGTVAIANNAIGAITVNGSAATVSASLAGIQVTAGANTISNNLVGSTTTANSLNAATSSTSGTAQLVFGIRSSSTGSASITGNTVANLNNNYNSNLATGQIGGIATSAGVNTITGNTVRELATTSQNGNTDSVQSVYGIFDSATAAGQTVAQNIVHSLANNTTANVAASVTGIYFGGPTSGANVVAGNLIHSLAVSASSGASHLVGIYFANATFTARNNMVRVGIKADGTSTAPASTIIGIFDVGGTAGRNFYHNSVYMGGTQTSGAASTRLFQSNGSGNVRRFQNNIFVNARSNGGTATSKHYAVIYTGTTVNPTGLTAGGNLLLASGTGGVLGLYNSADRTTLSAWQTATGQDATSLSADPLFLNPNGTAVTVDLHLPFSSPANNAGLALAAVTDDIDGRTRSLSAPDIGADEIGIATPTAPTVARDAATVTVPEGTIAFNSGTFADVNSDLVTVTASVGTITQSGPWTHQQTLTQGGNPIELVLDSQENLYVVNPTQNTLYKYNRSGSPVTSWTVAGTPTGVAVDSVNGWLYVVTKDGRRVHKFTLSGTLLTSWGSAGSGDGQFNLPHCVAVDVAGDVYVTDSFNSRIQVFSPAGTFLRKWGSAGSGNGQFNFPQGLRVSAGGTLYVADRNNHRVQYFDTAGNFLGKWGSNGSGDGQFNAPAGIGIDPGGNIVVGDLSNNRIQRFTANGTFVDKLGPSTTAGGLALPHGAAFPPSGRSVYIADFSNGRVLKFATPGGWNWSYTPTDSAAGPVTVTITATDNDIPNLSSTTTFTLNVDNVAPTIALTGNATVPNGTAYLLNLGAVTDPGTDTVSAFSINWGDGSTENFSGNPASTAKVHTYTTLGAKTITVTLTDEDGTFTGGNRSVTVENAAPVAGSDGLNRTNTTKVAKVLKSVLLSNDTDADGDPLTLTAVGNALPAGATVTMAGNFVVYTAPSNNAGNGSFTYTLSDGPGGHTVTGTVAVIQGGGSSGSGSAPNAVGVTPSGNDFVVTFLGVPGGSFRVQYTTSTAPPYVWNEFAPPAIYTAAPNGVFSHTDVNPPSPMRLYRAVGNP
jgi:sugar lactone lactonase YvrE